MPQVTLPTGQIVNIDEKGNIIGPSGEVFTGGGAPVPAVPAQTGRTAAGEPFGPDYIGSKYDISKLGEGEYYSPTGEIRQQVGYEKPIRYSLEDEAAGYYSGLARAPVDEATIRQEMQDKAQKQIDAINQVYAGIIGQERELGVGREGQTRAIGARGGLLGSPMGQAQMEKTKGYTEQNVRLIEAEKLQKVQNILGNYDIMAEQKIQAEKATVAGNWEKYLDYLSNSQTKAREDFKELAALGTDWEKLDQNDKDMILKQTGYTENQAKLKFNAAKVAAEKIDYKFDYDSASGMIYGYGVDPKTGKLSIIKEQVAITGLDPKNIKEVDGEFWAYDPETQTMKKLGGEKKIKYQAGIIGEYEYYRDQTVEIGGQPMSFNDYQNMDANRKRSVTNILNSGLDWKTTNYLNTVNQNLEANPITKQFAEVQNKYQSVKQIIGIGVGGPGDLALVYEFMKALDPTSVVRESEYSAAAKSGNIFSGALARFNGYFKEEGGILPENVKGAFEQIIKVKFDTIQSQYSNLRKEKERIIKNTTGINNPGDYLTDYDYGIGERSLKEQVDAAGYDYDAMRTDGLTDDQIQEAINQ